jgi:hypothetical protein
VFGVLVTSETRCRPQRKRISWRTSREQLTRSSISTTVDEVAVDAIAEVIGCRFIMSRLACHRHPLAFATASLHVSKPPYIPLETDVPER